MGNRGFFFDLSDEMENNGNVHQALVGRIETVTSRSLVCHFANFGHPGGAIQDHDPDLLENLLRSIDLDRYERRLDLLVNSPGGFPYAAGKIVKVCRTYAKEFRVVVVGRAMSAGTLLCLGADNLALSQTASLGPIDPQMMRGTPQGPRLVPATVVIQSFLEMVGAAQQAVAAKRPADPYLHVLDTLDVTAVFEAQKAIEATKAIAADLLGQGLLRADTSKVPAVVQHLLEEGQKELHGKHLYPDSVEKALGRQIEHLEKQPELDDLFRQLLVRAEIYAQRKGLAKYWVTRNGGIDVQVATRGGG